MKVVIVNTAADKGGAAVAANRLMQSLCAAGVECNMLVRESNGAQKKCANIFEQLLSIKMEPSFVFLGTIALADF